MATTERTASEAPASLVGLLGDTRAEIVQILKADGEHSAPELAEALGISDVAVRRHLAVLDREGLVAERTVKQDRGRPVARYRLSPHGRELFPNRYADVAGELLDYLEDEHGRAGLQAFLRWRQARETTQYESAIDADELPARLAQLAEALTDAGYDATVERSADGWELKQTHCAILAVAQEHPEMCAHEAAMFRRVLGDDAKVSRRETLASGGQACVCCVSVKDDA